MSAAQESVLMRPTDAASLGLTPVKRAKLVVLKSPALEAGEEVPVDSMPVAIGRGGQNEVPLDGDEVACLEHEMNYDKARFLNRQAIRGEIASDIYHGGVLDSGGGHLHPLNYAIGLAEAGLYSLAVKFAQQAQHDLLVHRVKIARRLVG